MTNIEIRFYERIPNELHKLNENLEKFIGIIELNNKILEELINHLMTKENGTDS